MADNQGNGETNDEHVDGKLTKEKADREFPFGSSREWYHDDTHRQMNQGAIQDAADEGVAY